MVKIRVFLFALIAIVMSLSGQMSAAEKTTIPNGPPELIGHYGKNPAQCQSHHRKSDNLTSIESTTYTFCGGSGCEATIVSHRKLPDGFVLNLRSLGNPKGWSERVRVLDKNVFEFVPEKPTDSVETLVRCTEADVIAGIGLKPNTQYNLTKSMDGVFAAYYALAVPNKCPSIEADEKAISTIVEAGRLLWTEFLKKGPNARFATPDKIASDILGEKRDAEIAVRLDADEIKTFCSEVLNVFGERGRVFPNLLKDKRRKA